MGAHLGREVISGWWSQEDASLSINARELLVEERSLLHFLPLVVGSTVSIFANNSTAVARGEGRSATLNTIAQRILRWAESHHIVLAPQFIMGRNNVLADALSRSRARVDVRYGSLRRTLAPLASHGRSLCHLSQLPLLSLFFSFPRSSSSGDGCASPQLGPYPGVCVPSVGLDSSSPLEAPILVRRPDDPDCSILASTSLVPGPSGSGSGSSDRPSSLSRSPQTAALPSSSSRGLQGVASCVETIQRVARAAGFSASVAAQVGLARRPSLRTNFQLKWSVCRDWCRREGHSISRPSLPKVADFLFWLRRSKGLSVSSILGYRSMLSAVFRSTLPSISSDPVLRDLIRSFKVEAPSSGLGFVASVTLPYISFV